MAGQISKNRKYRKLSTTQSAPECEESQHRYLAIWTWTCFDHRLSIRRWLAFPIEVQITWSHRHAMLAIQRDCNYKGDDYFLRNSWELLNYLMPWGYGYLHRQLFGVLTDRWFAEDTNSHTHNLTRKNILHGVAKTSNSPLLIPNISNLHNLHWTSLKDSYILKWLDKKLHLGSAVLGRTGDWCSTWATRSLT